MSDPGQGKSGFWGSLPGVLTALAALVAALAGAFQIYRTTEASRAPRAASPGASAAVDQAAPPKAHDETSPGNPPVAAAANASPGCLPGYFWRLARPTDRICVSAATRDATAAENALADEARSQTGGAYGASTCKSGFVWREAYDGDTVCVTPDSRGRAHQDNALAADRVAG